MEIGPDKKSGTLSSAELSPHNWFQYFITKFACHIRRSDLIPYKTIIFDNMKAVVTALLFLSTVAAQEDEESLTRYLRAQSHIVVDPKTVELKDDSDQHLVSRRTFVRYESSKWEQLWLDNVDKWATDKTICEELNSPAQMEYMHNFLTLLCSARYEAPYTNWCIIDDEHRPLWYNTADRTKYE
jgi:hypothetical protein